MDKQAVIAFFDKFAPGWDAETIRNEDAIGKILDLGGVKPGVHVLDVACGTGVLFPDYLNRGAGSVTAIDISSEMARIAQEKFPQVRVICADVETYDFDRQFDVVMVHNAFPHFPEPERLLESLAALTVPGGRLSIAHSLSKEMLRAHHSGAASKISIELMEEDALAKLMGKWFDVDVVLADDSMYQVSGVKRAE